MEEIDLGCQERFKEVLPIFKRHSIASRKEIENAHRYLDTLAAIKQYSTATQDDMRKLEQILIKLSKNNTPDINEFAKTFLSFIEIGYLKFP